MGVDGRANPRWFKKLSASCRHGVRPGADVSLTRQSIGWVMEQLVAK